MKQTQIVPIIIIVGVLIIAAAAVIYFLVNPAAWQSVAGQMDLSQPKASGLTASGFIEAEEVTIAPELGGRVIELLVEEGDDIEAGQVLVRLDGTLLEAQIEAAQANLDIAQAQLAQAQAGARPEQVQKAEADLAQAQA
ncbi:MAG: biotin/lipoyl-binding protein, partial [Anaerolineae bacterium]